MTHAIVLAAGLGRRLTSASPLPKWLTDVNGSSPGAMQMEALANNAVDHVHVVVNPWADEISTFLEPWHDRISIGLVVNDHAAEWNNWYSLLLGFDAVTAAGAHDVVVLNSDLYADWEWFSKLLGALGSDDAGAALAIDPSRGRTDEAMKVGLAAQTGLITGIGKVGVPDPGGEYVGLSWWSVEAAGELREILAGFSSDESRADHWYEHGIQDHIAAGGRYRALPVPNDRWVEIDDEHDLELARAITSPSTDAP